MRRHLAAIAIVLAANQFLRVVVLLIVGALVLAFTSRAMAQIPDEANRYRHDYGRIVRSEWGLAAPVASLAAQIHAESGWNCRAVSKVGARGCAQFMPATGAWIGEVDHSLKEGDLFSPAWAFRAQAVYMRWLFERVHGPDSCNRYGAALASYNQGLGWTLKAQHLAQTDRWFDAAERVNPGQAAWAIQESRRYPRRILFELEPRYVRAGWGVGSC